MSAGWFLFTHPHEKNGKYENYSGKNTVYKVLPFLMFTLMNPLCGLLFLADLFMDIEYVIPSHKYKETGFYAGFICYCLFHFINTEYLAFPFLCAYFGCQYIFRELRLQNELFMYYIFLIYARFVSNILAFNLIGALSVMFLAAGDLLLIIHRTKHPIKYKDIVVMSLSYVHLFLQ